MPYLPTLGATATLMGPHAVFLVLVFLFGGHFQGEFAAFARWIVVGVVLGALGAASVATWTIREDPAVARLMLRMAGAIAAAMVIGAVVSAVVFIGLLSVFEILFLLSLPGLVLASWNAVRGRAEYR